MSAIPVSERGTPEIAHSEGEYGAHISRDGVMVPGRSEVAWPLAEGRFAYWRGRPVSIEYEPAGSPRATAPH